MRRPDVFTLDYSHPLAQGLVRAFLMGDLTSGRVVDHSLIRRPATYSGDIAPTPTLRGLQLNGVVGTSATKTSSADVQTGRLLAGLNSFSVVIDVSTPVWENVPVNNGQPFYVERAPVGKSILKLQMGGSGYTDGTKAHFIWRNEAGNIVEVLSTVDINGGEFFRIALVVNGTDIRMYVDNASPVVGARVIGTFDATTSVRCLIGRDIADVYANNNATIGHLLLYNRALSPAEIALLADRTDPMLGGLIVEERPVLYFDMGGSTTDALTASNLVTGSPVLGTPALGQTHALTASDLTTSAPVLGAPALTQAHALTAAGLTTSGPSLGAPALGQAHALTASGITVEGPVLGAPALAQIHALTAQNFATGSPVLGTPSLAENENPVDALTADPLVVGSPVLGTPALTQVHVLGSDGLVTGSPVLGSPTITQVHALAALGLTVGVPVLGTPALNGSDIVLIDASEVGRATTLQARNYRATLAKRNYTARM